jgi:hydrogenase maturation protease
VQEFPRILIVGIGSPHGDDAAGWRVVEELNQRRINSEVALRKARSPLDVLDALEGVQTMIIVDAAAPAGHPGRVTRIVCPVAPDIQTRTTASTHGIGVAEAMQLAKALGRLPKNFQVLAIEAERTGAGDGMSAAVSESVAELVNELTEQYAVPAV